MIDSESFSVKGAVKFMELTTRVRGSAMYNPGLAEPKIVIKKYAGTSEHMYQQNALVDAFGSAVLEPAVPRTTAIADGQPCPSTSYQDLVAKCH